MVVLDYVTVAEFISDRILHDGGLKLSTREDFHTWNDTIISALTYARVRHCIDLPSSQSIADCPVDSLGLPSPPQPPQLPLMRILTNSSARTLERPSPFPSVPTIVITPLLLPYMPLWSATLATLVLNSYTLRSALLLTQYALRTPILPRGLGPWALWLAISQLWNLLSTNYSVLSTFAVSSPV